MQFLGELKHKVWREGAGHHCLHGRDNGAEEAGSDLHGQALGAPDLGSSGLLDLGPLYPIICNV